jgi:NADPH:quinone reductase-like Zn-dependent oxidoreductase
MESKGLKVSCLLGFVLDCLSRSVIKKANQLGINYRFLFTSGDGKYLNEIREFCEKKQIVPVVDKIYSFEEANIALEYLESGQATGKVVVQIVS